ncbi:MAG: bifunctional adenosylcobinamide kinase/adenosylcobinamide-phosphate guanylyltransferase [Coriobacteriales bacterium]|jgi:adenosyl cobinamide kinase/adenosyl cobinamide phosphate guanylyltransferase|nr:bifunctional adenosylcobinamide kinase/adenosylcobinamide-phosphate guanylyltransferase [Coriobacteriales bacterium]
MILIIGGAEQGKLQYAQLTYPDRTVYQCELATPAIDLDAGIINSLHLAVLAMMRADIDPLAYFTEELPRLQDKVIICDDISSGVVPIDKEMRLWRDQLGHLLGLLSTQAEQVIRLFVGIPSRIK